MDLALIALLTFVAAGVGTLTGFGTSTLMVPVLASFYPLTQALLLVGIVHWFGNIWKMTLFRSGLRWGLILKFGLPGIVATVLGGFLIFRIPEALLSRLLGTVLLVYVGFLFVKRRFKVPQTSTAAMAGGTLYGFIAGVSGIGGAVRAAFLAAFDLPKAVYIATGGAIGLAVDSGRLSAYLWEGATLSNRLIWGLLLFIPASLAGARFAKRIVERIPQTRFRSVVTAFLCLIGLQLLLFPRLA